MKVAVAGHAIWLDTANEWSVAKGWDDESIQETHGLYLDSIEHGVQVHVRAQGKGPYPLTKDGLLEMLRDQQWASRPFDETQTIVGALIVVAGTFEMTEKDRIVREWFVTDGHALANVAMPATRERMATVLSSAERLVTTLRFHPDARSSSKPE